MEKLVERGVQNFSLAEYCSRAWISLSGCTFECKGCFSAAREPIGLAKIYHPELDIEPQEVYKEFIRDFLRVEYREAEGKVFVYPPLGG